MREGRRDMVNTRFSEEMRWLVVERGPISLACNLGANAQRLQLRPGKHRVMLASDKLNGEMESSIYLPPDSVAVLKSVDG